MAWIAVVTDVGRALMNSYNAGGHTLDIVGVTVGSGTVAEANLRIQTALTSEKDEGSIISVEEIEGGTKYKLQVGPAPASAGAYVAHQIGLWSKLDDGPETLMMLAQDSEGGVSVPLESVSPNFAFALFVALSVDNTGSLTVNIDETAYVTVGTMNAALEGKVDTEDVVNSLTTTEAGKALDARQGKILNDNKLDKSKVYNGLDQTQNGYALDARAAVKLDSRLGNIEEMAAVSVGPAASVSIDYANAKDAPFAKVLLYVKIEQQGSGTPSAGNVRPFVPQSNFSISVDTGGFMPQTISFRMMQSLYGGIIDLVNQKYIRVYGYIPTYGGESLPGVWYSSKDVYAEGATPSTGAEVVYALATPVVESISVATFNMTPKTVHAITAGTGVSSVSASYFTDDKLVTEAQMNAAIQQSTAFTGWNEINSTYPSWYTKIGSIVYVAFRLTGGATPSQDTYLGTLPAELWPSFDIVQLEQTGNAILMVRSRDGAVYIVKQGTMSNWMSAIVSYPV